MTTKPSRYEQVATVTAAVCIVVFVAIAQMDAGSRPVWLVGLGATLLVVGILSLLSVVPRKFQVGPRFMGVLMKSRFSAAGSRRMLMRAIFTLVFGLFGAIVGIVIGSFFDLTLKVTLWCLSLPLFLCGWWYMWPRTPHIVDGIRN